MLVNGVASGDTTQASSVLWTRSDELGDVTFEYSTDPDFNTIVGTQTATVTDPTLPVKVLVEDLEPNTQYFYRVTDSEGDQLTGRLSTPALEGEQVGLRFGLINCNFQGAVPLISMSNIPEQNLDFLLNLGDTVYQDGFVATAPELPFQSTTLAEMRAKYGEVYGEHFGLSPYADARASTSVYSMIDDHEVTDNFQGGAPADSDSRFPETEGLINETQLYQNGLQAFQEYAPIDEKVYEGTGDPVMEGRPNLYRSQTFGSDAVLIMPDTRSFRDPALPIDRDNPEPFFEASITEDRTLLRETQLEQLKQDLLEAEESGVTWKVVANSVEMQQWGEAYADDRWEGYARERNEILQFIDENDIDNVLFVSGDWHGYNVNNLTYQTEFGGEQIATSAFEVVVGSGGSNPYGPGWTRRAGLDNELFNSLPIAPDTDSIIDDKDDFTKINVIDAGMEEGYDPMGLNNNLPQAEGLIDAELLQGDYVGNFHLSWSEFDIDSETQQLTVTTYGILPYRYEDIPNDPSILEREPEIISQFVVNPEIESSSGTVIEGTDDDDRLVGAEGNDTIAGLFGNDEIDGFDGDDVLRGDENSRSTGGVDGGDDTINGGNGNDRIGGKGGDDELFGDAGNDSIWGDDGDDLLRGGLGDDTLTGDDFSGGEGADIFVLAVGEGTDIITDFEIGIDAVELFGDLIPENLTVEQHEADAVISLGDEVLGIFNGVDAVAMAAANPFI